MSKLNNITTINATNANDIGELKGLLASARSQGLTVAIVKLPRKFFAIDQAYQTKERTERSLNYLVNDFRREKLLPLTGVPHDEEGKVYLVDGYGRWKASEIVDAKNGTNEYAELQCMVILNAPTEPTERRKYEAEQYAFQNKNIAKLTALQKHGALKCMNDSGAVLLEAIVKEYAITPTSTAGVKHAGHISYNEFYNICKVNGEDCIRFIMDICKGSGFHIKPCGYAAYVLRGLRDTWKYYPEHREQAKEFLTGWLRERTPDIFKAKAVSRYPMLDYRSACSLYMEDLLVDNIDLKHVRQVEGKSITQITKVA